MIHEIGVELGAALAAQGCPLPVIDGPEATTPTTFARERIVIEHDDGDTFGPTRSNHRNPKERMIRNIAVRVRIYVQAGEFGVMHWEHRRRAEHVLDLVLVALEKVIIARKNGWTLKSGKFFVPDDLAPSEVASGAAYELLFTVERGIFAQTWAGAKRPEGVAGTDFVTRSHDLISIAGSNAQPETAC